MSRSRRENNLRRTKVARAERRKKDEHERYMRSLADHKRKAAAAGVPPDVAALAGWLQIPLSMRGAPR